MSENPVTPTPHDDDALPAPLVQAQKLVSQFRRELVAVIVVICLAAGAYAFAMHSQQKADAASWAAVQNAEMIAANPTQTAQNLDRVLREHAGTEGAAYALLKQIQLLADENRPDEAVDAANAFLSQYAGHYFAPQVRLSLAKLLMLQSKHDQALEQIRRGQAEANRKNLVYLEPELQLAYAHALEEQAEAVRGTPEYAQRLDAARAEYVKIESNEGWPRPILSTASFAIVAIKQRLSALETSEASTAETAAPQDEAAAPAEEAATAEEAPAPAPENE